MMRVQVLEDEEPTGRRGVGVLGPGVRTLGGVRLDQGDQREREA